MRIINNFKLSFEIFFSFALLILIFFLHKDYGISADEMVHLNYGDWILAWYTSLGNINAAVTATSCKYYGGLADTLTQSISNMGTLLFAWDPYEQRHFITALFGLLGIFYTHRLGSLFGGRLTGRCASIVLLLTPRWFGHMFDNPKDIPFAVAYTAALFYLLRPLDDSKGYEWKACMKIGLAIGAALAIRIGGLFLFIYLGLTLSSVIVQKWNERNQNCPSIVNIKTLISCVLPRFVAIVVLAWTVMLIFWPYAQLAPFTHPFQVMQYMSKNPWGGECLFSGKVLSSCGTAF